MRGAWYGTVVLSSRQGKAATTAWPAAWAIVLALAAAGPLAAQEAGAERTSRLQGAVLAGPREPLLGAAVLVRPADDPGRVWLTTTGDRGAFRVDGLPDGVYTVTIARAGYATVFKPAIELRYPFRAVVEVRLEKAPEAPDLDDAFPSGDGPVRVDGVALGPDGRPLADVRVRLVHVAGRHDPRALRTGEDGRFHVDDLPADAWRFEIEGVGMLDLRKIVRLIEDTAVTVVLVPQPADYEPSPLELMPPERPIPPDPFGR